MSRVIRRFSTLQWRLMLSYFVTALTALLLLEGTFVVVPGVIALTTPQRPTGLLPPLDHLAPQAARYLAQTPPDRVGLAAWQRTRRMSIANLASDISVDSARTFAITPGQNAALLVVDGAGQAVVAPLAPTATGVGDFADIQSFPATGVAVAAALAGSGNSAHLLQVTSDGLTIAAAPIKTTKGAIIGALVLGVDIGALRNAAFRSGLVSLLISVVPFSVIASVVGAVFGLLTARGLTRRLRRLTTAANAWSRGEFQVTARDPTHDELGALAGDLNSMAAQLQRLVTTRQELAIVDERQRMARDLHDSVKQQLFVLTLLVTSARDTVSDDPQAGPALAEASQIAGQMSQELTALIRALRPISLESKGLVVALRELTANWARSTGIAAEVCVPDHLPTTGDAEDALFRVAQEALANVGRHSGATRVTLTVLVEPDAIRMQITDNGHGFDLARAAGSGVGLNSMRERMAALGGALLTTSLPSGTCITASVPRATASEADEGAAPASVRSSGGPSGMSGKEGTR